MTLRHSFIGVLALIAAPASVGAQRFGIAPHAGTLGVGVDIVVAVHPRVNLRVGGNVFPFDIDITASDVEYSVDLPSPQFTATVDLFLASQFRLSGGVMVSGADLEATGTFTGTVDIGGTIYSGADVGTLTGAIVNNDLAPYIGIGWGNPAGSRFGLFVDLGVAFQAQPQVTLQADGPVASLMTFVQDLNQEIQDFEDEVDLFKFYPVASLGFSIGF